MTFDLIWPNVLRCIKSGVVKPKSRRAAAKAAIGGSPFNQMLQPINSQNESLMLKFQKPDDTAAL
uniref:Uncharacterized protein n=1 Tax=Anguilla anguilla TaxID=7936 RepID=A0A0E9RWE4_ANGAN